MLNSIKVILSANKTGIDKKEKYVHYNPDAGLNILTHFQKQWVQLHDTSETNAKKASDLAEKIITLHETVAKDFRSISHLIYMLNMTQNIKSNIEVCFKQIKDLHFSFEHLEHQLINLEDLVESCELETKKIEHRHQLSLYKEKKLAGLEAVRSNLATKHAQNVIDHELKQKKLLLERQEVFQEAFKKDLETYKTVGSIPKIDLPKPQSSALLEEIQLEIDDKELDTFLNNE